MRHLQENVDQATTRRSSRLRARRACVCAAGIVALAFGAAACGSSSKSTSTGGSGSASSSGSTGGMPTVKLAYVAPVSDLQLPLIAQKLGFFKKYGVNVVVSSLPQTQAIPALVSGQVQMASFESPGPEVQYMDGTHLQWLMQWENHSNSVLLGRNGVSTVKQLAGKTAGITTTGTSSQVLTQLALDKAGVKANLQPLGSVSAMGSAFQAGSITAAVVSPPQDLSLLHSVSGAKLLVDYGKEFPWPGGGLAALSSWSSAHSATTVKVLEGLTAAINYLKSHPEKGEKIIAAADDQTLAEAKAGFKATMTLVNQISSPAPNPTAEKQVLAILKTDYKQANSLTPDKFYDSTYISQALKKVPFKAKR